VKFEIFVEHLEATRRVSCVESTFIGTIEADDPDDAFERIAISVCGEDGLDHQGVVTRKRGALAEVNE
jgi:hypothetical protein